MKGGTAKATVLEQFVAVTAADVAVVCRAVPARESVPKRSYGELEAARAAFGVAESKTPILTACPAAYASGNKLHFQAAVAAEAEHLDTLQEARRARGRPQPTQPTRQEMDEHALTHMPYRSWCPICVKAKGKQDAYIGDRAPQMGAAHLPSIFQSFCC